VHGFTGGHRPDVTDGDDQADVELVALITTGRGCVLAHPAWASTPVPPTGDEVRRWAIDASSTLAGEKCRDMEGAMPNPVVHFEIMGQRGPQLPDFYRQLLGWPVGVGEPVEGYAKHSAIGPQNGQGIGGGVGATNDEQSFVTIHVEVDDLDETRGAVERLGGEVVLRPCRCRRSEICA
jgi:predicted enzyme related to lactoylglutathione lyase